MKKFFKKIRHKIFGGQQVVDRDRLIYAWLRELPAGEKILLDAGAGSQRFKPFCSHLQYLSQDFGEYVGGDLFAGQPLETWQGHKCDIICDITAIPLPDRAVDFILCTEVFEHLPDPAAALAEFSRLLKGGGRVLITSPFNSQYHQTPYFFYSGFSSEFYKHYARKFGFSIASLDPIGDYYQSVCQELLRLPFLCRNPLLSCLMTVLICPAVLANYLLFKLKKESPRAPFGYAVVLTKSA
jgi:ubiquinone/menaquinone biosynthesis C-methylase UbiE